MYFILMGWISSSHGNKCVQIWVGNFLKSSHITDWWSFFHSFING